jgi:urea transport system ATP-binding protein
MHAGKIISEGTVAQVQADPRVQEVYLGTAADAAEIAEVEAAEATVTETETDDPVATAREA